MHKYLVLLCDNETDEDDGYWSVAMQTESKSEAQAEYESLKHDGTPAMMLYTGDFITF